MTYIEENCDEGINHLLDESAGTWLLNDKNYGDALFEITRKCLEEKRRRPEMIDVASVLMELINDI